MYFFLLDATTPAASTASQMWSMPLMLGLMFLVMYFFMIRPQQKRQKAEETFRSGLAKGDKIVTIGGIHGKIISVEDTTVIIEAEVGNTRLKMEKSALRASTDTTSPNELADK